MKRYLKLVFCVGLGCAVLLGCQKKTETTTTETSKTVEQPAAAPNATPGTTESTTTTTTSTGVTPVPTKAS